MKKLSLALLAILAFTFVGCNGWLDIPDPEPEPEPEPEPVEEALITLEETSATLSRGDTYQINAECENPITYSSDNEFCASVSEEGLVTANYVGTAVITLESESDTKTFEVTVEGQSDLYPEPEIEIGETKEAIIERFGAPGAETEEAIGYANYSENTTMLMVMFDEDNLVTSYSVIMDVSLEEELDTFLSERYMFVQEEEGIKVYINALTVDEATLLVGSQNYQGEFLMAMYFTNDEGGNEGGDGEEKSDVVKALLKQLVK